MGCCDADRRRVHAGEGLHGMLMMAEKDHRLVADYTYRDAVLG